MDIKDVLISEFDVGEANDIAQLPSDGDVSADVAAIYQSHALQKLIRFYNQTYWEAESSQLTLLPGSLYLENVAAHTFQVAYAAQLLVDHFPQLNRLRAIELALVHDQPEILTGDKDPVGHDGQGLSTHAFNADKQSEKQREELCATKALAEVMRPSARRGYEDLIGEFISCKTAEALFVKSLDKLQALTFVRIIKNGNISPQHMAFTIRYSRLGIECFPSLRGHFKGVLKDILSDVELHNPDFFGQFCRNTSYWLVSGASAHGLPNDSTASRNLASTGRLDGGPR